MSNPDDHRAHFRDVPLPERHYGSATSGDRPEAAGNYNRRIRVRHFVNALTRSKVVAGAPAVEYCADAEE